MRNFDIDFVRNTKRVLASYRGQYNVSNLLNCTLGLIILPYENIDTNDQFWNTEISQVKGLPAFSLRYFEPIQRVNKGKTTYFPKSLAVLLRKVRNGLAHQNIEPINNNKKVTGVIIRNYYPDGDQKHRDLEIEFSIRELKQFALFIADQYLSLAATHI